jgi:paraquat-inducible protein A
MITRSIFGTQPDTILSGVAYLWHSGSWPLAVLVFVASVLVPLLKLLALSYLAASTQRRSRVRQRQKTRLYRLLEFVGRWSMLDVFVVMVLVALVKMGALANIQAGPGAMWFGAVVVLTMFASMSFDPRLIWDASTARDG